MTTVEGNRGKEKKAVVVWMECHVVSMDDGSVLGDGISVDFR